MVNQYLHGYSPSGEAVRWFCQTKPTSRRTQEERTRNCSCPHVCSYQLSEKEVVAAILYLTLGIYAIHSFSWVIYLVSCSWVSVNSWTKLFLASCMTPKRLMLGACPRWLIFLPRSWVMLNTVWLSTFTICEWFPIDSKRTMSQLFCKAIVWASPLQSESTIIP